MYDTDLHKGTQLGRKVRRKIAGKVIMNPRKTADMIFREAHGPFEIVRADFFWVSSFLSSSASISPDESAASRASISFCDSTSTNSITPHQTIKPASS